MMPVGRDEPPSDRTAAEGTPSAVDVGAGDDPGAGSPTVIDRPQRPRVAAPPLAGEETSVLAADVASSPTFIKRAGRDGLTPPMGTVTPTGTGTQARRAAALVEGRTASIAGGAGSGSLTVGSPLAALAHAELLRTRNFAKVGIAIAIAGAVAVAVLPGERVSSVLMEAAIGAGVIALLYMIHRARTPATFQPGLGLSIAWYVPALGVCAAIPYFGPYSPAPVLLILGIYVLGMGAGLHLAIAIYVTCALAQGCTGALAIAGVGDPGFVKASYLTTPIQILCQVLVQVVLAGTFFIARGSRRSHLAGLAELERVVRAVAQREALLEEAREELRGALGRTRGRFTDQQIGRYTLGDVIGRGAMGEVYEASDPAAEQPVAIKMLASSSLGNAHHVERFLRELRTASAIDSPNVVRVIEIGEYPLPHLVMERLRGRDLASILRDKRPMSKDRIVDMLRQVGTGVTAASAAGVIHRDLKPGNLFLSGATWKILDFGVSRLADSGDTLTAGHVVGTPAYMAPEQARGAEVSHRTDLYALAAIAYRVLTGHAPFTGGEIADVLYRVVHTAPRRPSSLASISDDVDAVLAIGLAKEPADRFATAAELAEAVAAALAGTLDEATRSRGAALIAAGGWAAAPVRPPT
jgi:serine/threonine-protein kinase